MADSTDSTTNVSLLGRVASDPTDQAAWAEFVGRYAPKILAWCRAWGLQDSDARDVTQDVLLRLSVQMRKFRYAASGSFRGWLRVMTRHALADFLADRRKAAGPDRILERLEEVEARDDLVRHLEAEFDAELLEEASRRVRRQVQPRTWEAFRLTAIEGRGGAVAARQLGMEVATVYVAKGNVLKRLRDQIRLLEGDDRGE